MKAGFIRLGSLEMYRDGSGLVEITINGMFFGKKYVSEKDWEGIREAVGDERFE